MKTVKIKIEADQEFEIKVEDKDIDTLVKVINVFEKQENSSVVK
jgi:hypothetical protein